MFASAELAAAVRVINACIRFRLDQTSGGRGGPVLPCHQMRASVEAQLAYLLHDCRSVLDVGCGETSPLRMLPRTLAPFRIGIDRFLPALRSSRRQGTHDAYVQADATAVDRLFAIAPVCDAVIALDLVEHLDHDAGRDLLRVLPLLARRVAIVFTPTGFFPQAPRDGNPWQEHRSGWTPAELRSLGYDVIGLGGWRVLQPLAARHRLLNGVAGRIGRLSHLWLEGHPEHAFQQLAIRRITSGRSS